MLLCRLRCLVAALFAAWTVHMLPLCPSLSPSPSPVASMEGKVAVVMVVVALVPAAAVALRQEDWPAWHRLGQNALRQEDRHPSQQLSACQ